MPNPCAIKIGNSGFSPELNMIGEWRLNQIVRLVGEGGVIAYPTEGVWGLGCHPQNIDPVLRILTMKRRSWTQGLILVAADIEQFAPYLMGLGAIQLNVLRRNWPGEVTYLVPDNGCCPAWIKGEHGTVALRVSRHPVIQSLCHKLDSPLVSTSANQSGCDPLKSALQIRKVFGGQVDAIVPGQPGPRVGASEIQDLLSGQVLRAGS